MNYELLFSFALATASLAVSPGPDNIFVLMQSMVHGKKYGLATVFGLMTGCLVHTSLVAFGVSAVIQNSPSLFTGIKWFGATYLLYLAYQVFRSDSKILLSSEGVERKSTLALFRQGFIMNVLNPKVSIFFLAFFPAFLFSDQLSEVLQFYILGLIFIVVSFIVFSSIALLAGRIATWVGQHKQLGGILKWMQIIVFVGIAILIVI